MGARGAGRITSNDHLCGNGCCLFSFVRNIICIRAAGRSRSPVENTNPDCKPSDLINMRHASIVKSGGLFHPWIPHWLKGIKDVNGSSVRLPTRWSRALRIRLHESDNYGYLKQAAKPGMHLIDIGAHLEELFNLVSSFGGTLWERLFVLNLHRVPSRLKPCTVEWILM